MELFHSYFQILAFKVFQKLLKTHAIHPHFIIMMISKFLILNYHKVYLLEFSFIINLKK